MRMTTHMWSYLKFRPLRWTTSVFRRLTTDRRSVRFFYFLSNSLAELPALCTFPVDSGIVISPLETFAITKKHL